MPYKERNLSKKYWSIGEVADELGVLTSTLRFWVKEFPMLKPKRDKKGHRRFTEKDVNMAVRIHHLIKIKKLTIDGARQFLQHSIEGQTEVPLSKPELVHLIKEIYLDMNNKLSDETIKKLEVYNIIGE